MTGICRNHRHHTLLFLTFYINDTNERVYLIDGCQEQILTTELITVLDGCTMKHCLVTNQYKHASGATSHSLVIHSSAAINASF